MKTQHIFITNMTWSMLFKEIISVYSGSHAKTVNTICGKMYNYRMFKQIGKVYSRRLNAYALLA